MAAAWVAGQELVWEWEAEEWAEAGADKIVSETSGSSLAGRSDLTLLHFFPSHESIDPFFCLSLNIASSFKNPY